VTSDFTFPPTFRTLRGSQSAQPLPSTAVRVTRPCRRVGPDRRTRDVLWIVWFSVRRLVRINKYTRRETTIVWEQQRGAVQAGGGRGRGNEEAGDVSCDDTGLVRRRSCTGRRPQRGETPPVRTVVLRRLGEGTVRVATRAIAVALFSPVRPRSIVSWRWRRLIRCECRGFTEDCTPAYIASVHADHMGRWVCGLCAEAVGDEVRRARDRITTAEALDRHVALARAGSGGRRDEEDDLVARLLQRCLDSPPAAAARAEGDCLTSAREREE
jgi:hypothetical protein